jgi:hypothetical protein
MKDSEWNSEEFNESCNFLLRTILGCGDMDLPTLIYVIDMDNELFSGDCLDEAFCELGSCSGGRDKPGVDFNRLLGNLMYGIVYDLASELDEGADEPKYGDIMSEHWNGGFTNYMDSHFGIECLDDWCSGESKKDLLVKLKAEFDMWEEKNKGLDKSWNNE